jgi:hypothetical protein
MEIDWKKVTLDFIRDGDIQQIKLILTKIIPNRKNLPGDIRKNYESFLKENRKESLQNILDYLTTQYSTFLFPAMLTSTSAPNFHLYGEKDQPHEQEAWKTLYLIISAASFEDILMNLDNVKEDGRKAWHRQLASEDPKQFLKGISSQLGLRSQPKGTFFIPLLGVSYFVLRTKTEIRSLLGLEDYLKEMNNNYGFNDNTTLVVFQLGERKEVHYFNRLRSFILKWYSEYLNGNEDEMSLIKFLDSLTVMSNKANIDSAIDIRDKLAYYLLKYNVINAELLSQLTELRLADSLLTRRKKKKIYSISNAKNLFSKL